MKKHFETLSIHAGEEADQHQALNPPMHMTSTFTFNDLQQADDTFSFKRKAYVYTRGGNPTINLLERRMAALSGGIDAVAFASGMAAIASTLLSLAEQGDEILMHRNLYGSTYTLTANLFPKYGITPKYIDMTSLDTLKLSITKKTKCLFLETPTNPALEIIDILSIAKIAHDNSIPLVVDNTFATPYFQKPLELGADIVIHSATKYLSGHGDIVAGIVIARDQDYLHRLKFDYLCELGGVISPFNAWLILRGLKTLSLRMERHEKNAQTIVEFLNAHPKVETVMYPGLPNHPSHDIAKKQMTGFGGILSFELKGDQAIAKTFVENVQLLKIAVSLGDTESLIEIPALMTHRGIPKEKLSSFGFSEKTIRISAGLEHAEDIIEDIEQALKNI